MQTIYSFTDSSGYLRTKKIIDQIGICHIIKYSLDSEVTRYSVEISGIEIFHCGSLENCYTHANGIYASNPVSQRVEAFRHMQKTA